MIPLGRRLYLRAFPGDLRRCSVRSTLLSDMTEVVSVPRTTAGLGRRCNALLCSTGTDERVKSTIIGLTNYSIREYYL